MTAIKMPQGDDDARDASVSTQPYEVTIIRASTGWSWALYVGGRCTQSGFTRTLYGARRRVVREIRRHLSCAASFQTDPLVIAAMQGHQKGDEG